jgi:23S rRNA pseudouridine2605 synthase
MPKRNSTREEETRLNKYLAHCGIASRRKADELIKAGNVSVNGVVVREPGSKVKRKDEVRFKGKPVKPVRKLVYLLLNKPKNTITTTSDEKGRKTVMQLIRSRDKSLRIYPVGRLDRHTTGLLLLTNDGDLAKKLTHPSHRVKKMYHVVLSRPLQKDDLTKIRSGLQLEDGPARVDQADYVQNTKDEVILTLHVGRNRIIRRIFEALGYEVLRLDRIYLGGLTKKGLARGRYRHLTNEEIRMLKHFV